MFKLIASKQLLSKNLNFVIPQIRSYVPATSAMEFKQKLKHKHFGRAPVYFAPTAEDAVYNIITNTPKEAEEKTKRHVLNLLVQNEPGVLSRLTGILAGRNFNIESLVVANTEVSDLSRMTIVFNGKNIPIEQARKQLEDLVPVWAVLDYTNTRLIERELLLMKVSTLGPEYIHKQLVHAKVKNGFESDQHDEEEEELDESPSTLLRTTHDHLRAITELTRLFEGKIVDVSGNSVAVELCAKPERVSSFMKLCKPFGIIECSRTGVMAMPRTPVEDSASESSDNTLELEEDEAIDLSALPPS